MTFACERFRSYIFGWQVSWLGPRNFAERLLDPWSQGPVEVLFADNQARARLHSLLLNLGWFHKAA
jgi:hypothetical protein